MHDWYDMTVGYVLHCDGGVVLCCVVLCCRICFAWNETNCVTRAFSCSNIFFPWCPLLGITLPLQQYDIRKANPIQYKLTQHTHATYILYWIYIYIYNQHSSHLCIFYPKNIVSPPHHPPTFSRCFTTYLEQLAISHTANHNHNHHQHFTSLQSSSKVTFTLHHITSLPHQDSISNGYSKLKSLHLNIWLLPTRN